VNIFDYLYDALNQGTPVILELYYLDDIAGGSVQKILVSVWH